jgi:hypothetical protein
LCSGTANVLYNPFEDSLYMVAVRSAHTGHHTDVSLLVPDVPKETGTKALHAVRCGFAVGV